MAPGARWQGFDLAQSVGYLLRMVGTAELPVPARPAGRFGGLNPREAALKSVQTRKIRSAQRSAAVAAARLGTANDALSILRDGKSTIDRARDERSDAVMSLLSVEAVKQAEKLAKAPSNDPGVFKTLVDACDRLFGWSRDGGPRCLVQIGTLNQLAEPLQSADNQLKSPDEGKLEIKPVELETIEQQGKGV